MNIFDSMTRRSLLRGLAGAGLLAVAPFALARPLRADPGQEAAVALVERMGQEAISVLGSGAADRDQAFARLFDEYFAVERIARFVVARSWGSLDEAQRSRYLDLFRKLVISAYARRLSRYSGQTFAVAGATSNPPEVVVASEIRDPAGQPPVAVQWRVREVDGQLKIVDVIVERVSLIITQRDEFQSIIQANNGNFDALLADLQARTGG